MSEGGAAVRHLYVVICIDRLDAGSLRGDTRMAHLEFVQSALRVRLGGPFLDASGKMTGSLLIVEGESLEEVEAFAASDPYSVKGLFETIDVRLWKQTVGPVSVSNRI